MRAYMDDTEWTELVWVSTKLTLYIMKFNQNKEECAEWKSRVFRLDIVGKANMRWGRCRISAILQSNKKIKSNGSKMFAHLRLSNIQWNDSRQWIVSIRKRFIHDWYRFVWERLNLAALIMETKTHWQLNPILLCLLLLFVEWQKKSEKRIIKPARLAHTAGKL